MSDLPSAFPSPSVHPCPDRRRAQRRRLLALAVVASGMFMGVLDTTIVNVALPAIQASFGAGGAALAWIVDAYTLSFAAFILLGGVASDRLGARRVYLAGLAFFVGASALCGFASGIGLLILARFVQGLGAALFLPASLALVRQVFDEPGERARAIAIWATIASAAAALGPLAGGVLVDAFGWRSSFLVNLPVGALGLALTAMLVPARPGQRGTRIDLAGQVLSVLALALAAYAAIELPERGWASAAVWASAAGALATGIAFVAVERRALRPMVPLEWFAHRVVRGLTLAGMLFNLGYYGLLFVLSLYLQGERHLTAQATGFFLLPMALSLPAGNALAQRLVARLSAARMMTGGLGLAALALPPAIAALTRGGPPAWALAGLFVFGLGTALSVSPMIAGLLEQVRADQAGTASGLLNAMRQVGSLVGVAAAGGAVAVHGGTHRALWMVTGLATLAYAGATWLAHRSRS